MEVARMYLVLPDEGLLPQYVATITMAVGV